MDRTLENLRRELSRIDHGRCYVARPLAVKRPLGAGGSRPEQQHVEDLGDRGAAMMLESLTMRTAAKDAAVVRHAAARLGRSAPASARRAARRRLRGTRAAGLRR